MRSALVQAEAKVKALQAGVKFYETFMSKFMGTEAAAPMLQQARGIMDGIDGGHRV